MRLVYGSGGLLRRHFVVGSEGFAGCGVDDVEWHGSPEKSDLTPSPALLGGFVRPHNFAGKRLGSQSGLSQGLDVLSLLLALFYQLSLFGRRFVDTARKGAALLFALVGELLVRGRLLINLPPKLVHIALMDGAALGELGVEAIPLGLDVLQPVSKVLQKHPALLEKLFELMLGGQCVLKGFHRGGSLFEALFDGHHPLARVGCLRLHGQCGVRLGLRPG